MIASSGMRLIRLAALLRRLSAKPAPSEPFVAPPCGRTYSALAVSNELTAMGMRRSSMGHNKLVQIVQGKALALGRPIVTEMPQIWRYGPVLRSLYLVQNHLGHAIVERPLRAGPFDEAPRVDPDDAWTLSLVRRVMDDHASTSTLDLSSMLHAEGTPWKDEAAHHGFVVEIGATVPEWRIADHYRTRISA